MKTLTKSISLFAILFGLAACGASSSIAPPETAESATVRRVQSGDTLVIQTANMKPMQVQLFGIDAPEIGQGYVGKSQRRLQDLTTAAKIQFEMIGGPEDPGREVMLWADGQLVNELLLREGLAWVIPGVDEPGLVDAFAEARTNKRGLWKDNTQVPPWEFRGARRAEKRKNMERARALHKTEKPSVVDYRSVGLRDSYYYYRGRRYRRYRRYPSRTTIYGAPTTPSPAGYPPPSQYQPTAPAVTDTNNNGSIIDEIHDMVVNGGK